MFSTISPITITPCCLANTRILTDDRSQVDVFTVKTARVKFNRCKLHRSQFRNTQNATTSPTLRVALHECSA